MLNIKSKKLGHKGNWLTNIYHDPAGKHYRLILVWEDTKTMDFNEHEKTRLEAEMDFYERERTRIEVRDERERKYPILQFYRIGHPFWYVLIFLLAGTWLQHILFG